MCKDFGIPNESETNSNLDVSLCLTTATVDAVSPIDRFEQTQRDLVVRAWKTRNIEGCDNGLGGDNDPELIRLLLLGLVSSVENYFRQVLSRLLTSCPESQRICGRTEIKFAAARYHQQHHIALSLLDESVFSSSDNIENETKRLTGISPSSSGSVKDALNEYHKVCIIRHATVHSQGLVGAKNIMDLKISSRERLCVSLSVTMFEQIAEICVNLVRAYNSHMWKTTISRLANSRILAFDGSVKDRELFQELQSTFWANAKTANEPQGQTLYDRLASCERGVS